jgi:hypothetical protein
MSFRPRRVRLRVELLEPRLNPAQPGNLPWPIDITPARI